MLSIFGQQAGSRRWSRREWMRVGGLNAFGLSAGQLAELQAAAPNSKAKRPKSCVFLFLFGGPSQIDLWDMKPNAPTNIRGEFKPVSTSVPGIQVCEHLPKLAKAMDKICLVRSMTHNMNVHGPACSEIFSGRDYFQAPITDQARPEDWPSLSSMTMRFGPRRKGLPPAVVLPWYLQFPGQSLRIAGQTGGRMGDRFNALLINGDSKTKNFSADAFRLQKSVSMRRIDQRRQLLGQIQTGAGDFQLGGEVITQYKRHQSSAYSLLRNRAGEIMDLKRESAKTRQAYGHTMVGQSLLMARRLIEAEIPLVSVNWEDETKIDGVNTCWDTHQNNFPKLKKLLCPIFDQAFPAFINDLDQRGLLETTLVIAVGEFGRTPQMGQFSQSSNTKKSGRDHWPSVFTALMAGGGVRGGQVYGTSNRHGAFVKDDPVTPADLTATVLSHLGVDPATTYVDDIQKIRHQLSDGRPVNLS